jgi:prepilin-type N-terminal cleavage/methylation domain-containing protein
MVQLHLNDNNGFTLIELLISVAIFSIIVGAVFSFSIAQRKYLSVQGQVSEMIQNARAAMAMISGELTVAGYSPSGPVSNQPDPAFNAIILDEKQLQIQADLNGNRRTINSTKTDENPNELITYSYDPINKVIHRKTNLDGLNQPLVENVQNFEFEYLDAQGNPATTTANIRQIRLTITVRTSKPDPQYTANSGYRTFSLTSVVTPRNLAF